MPLEEQQNVGGQMQPTQTLSPILAFIAGFFAFGMGYVYVGRLRAGVITLTAESVAEELGQC
jgi:hypothetical protein